MIQQKKLWALPETTGQGMGKAECRVCGGTGWEIVELRQANLARRCRCRLERNEAFWRHVVGIPPRLLRKSWELVLTPSTVPPRAQAKIRNFLRHFPETPGTLFLVAESLQIAELAAAAILREIHRQKRCSVRFVDALADEEEGLPREEAVGASLESPDRADLVAYVRLLDSDLSEEHRSRWADCLHQRFLAQKHNLICLDRLSARALRRTLRNGEWAVGSALLRALKNLTNDCSWCVLYGENRTGVFRPVKRGGSHSAAA